ncbi:MAG: type II secretion system F family protein, partial [Gammaproteobacteria bacterium]
MMNFVSPFLFLIAVASTGLCVFLFIVLGNIIAGMVEGEDRTYMDPLPPMLKPIWPFIQVIAYFGCSWLPYEMLETVERRLQRTGVSFLLTAEQFLGLQAFSIIAWPITAVVMMTLMQYDGQWGAYIVLGAIFLGIAHPNLWLADNRKRRENAIIRGMPTYLDFITMCVEAGLNFQGALQQAMDKAPSSPLKNEFAIVLRDLRSGLSRSDALRRMADRLDIQETTSFVSAVIQAERMGSSL